MDRYKISEVDSGENEYFCFELFKVWIFVFSLKQETVKNHNRSVAELARS